MNYCLQVLAIGHPLKVELSESEFEELKQAKQTLTKFFSFTENYRVVVESYREVERAKHEAELDHMLYSNFGYESLADARVALNAPIVGYLSSARYFLDATDKFISKVLTDDQAAKYQTQRRKIYDEFPHYAFIEALRNYVQHRELPIHTVTYHNFIEDKRNHETSDMVTSLSLCAARETLSKDKKFKPSALAGLPDRISIVGSIRHHMEGIWRLHGYLMKEHACIPEAARERVAAAISRYEKETSDQSLGLHAIAYESEFDTRENVPILLNWDDARLDAEKRIGNLNHLHKRYVSGKNQ
ncbi:MAG: hypothetical protein ABIT37_05710 [Luteolibacter sp.]